MFIGRYEHTVDNKGRLAVPAKFRAQLEEGMFVTRGLDNCLALYPASVFQSLADKLNDPLIADANARNLRRIFFSEAADCEFDKQGRISLPAHLREYAGISADDAEVIVAGANTFIEIWSRERWQQVQTKAEANIDTFAAALASLGVM